MWLTTGDWHLDPQGGEHGDVVVDVQEGLDVEKEAEVEDLLLCVTTGDWLLTPQGGERGEEVFEVWEGLKAEVEEMVEDWPTIGD